MDKDRSELKRLVSEHGWAVMRIQGTDGEPDWAYTIGLYQAFKHPEVVIFGLAPGTMATILNIVARLVKDGAHFENGSESSDLITGHQCAFRAVAPPAVSHYLGLAVRYYGAPIPALQCYWPDGTGRFPWEAGTHPDYRRLQPKLGTDSEPSTTVMPR